MKSNLSIAAWLLLSSLCQGPHSTLLSAPAPPAAPARSEILAALERVRGPAADAPTGARPLEGPLRILLLANNKDHGPDEHDYPRWQECWAAWLSGGTAAGPGQFNLYGPAIPDTAASSPAANVEVLRAQGFPTETQLAAADVLVAFCYIPWSLSHRAQLRAYLERGGGLVLIHSATWTMPEPDSEIAALIGVGGFTRWRHGPVQIEITAPDHPICRGLPRQLRFYDETYWPPTPALDPARVNVLAASSEQDPGAESPVPQPILWTALSGRGRVFGCVLGHYSWTFDDPWFRLLLLRGMLWTANRPAYSLDHLALRGARVAGP